MKEIQIQIKINEFNQMANTLKVDGFDKDSVEGILIIIGILENLKLQQLNKLQNLEEV